MRIGFTMPAYNEEELLGETVDGVLPVVDRLVIVDDGSKDATGAIADRYKQHYPDRIDVIHQDNKGIGGAVIAGMRMLLARNDIDAIGIAASDNQCDPSLIPLFRKVLETQSDIDVAKGSRFLHPETLYNMPRFRYWGNRGVSAAMQLILGYWGMSDVLHGYLLGRRIVFETMDLSQIAEGYDLENTMMAEFRRLHCSIALLPSPSRYGREKSKIVYRTQIPKTLKKMAHLLGRRLVTGSLTDRLSPAMLMTGNVIGSIVAMRLTSPEVRIIDPEMVSCDDDGTGDPSG
jgi:glycosyltransferase involved in cell wall biosynthesis